MQPCPLCGNPAPIPRDAHSALCSVCNLLINLDTTPLDYADGGGQAIPDTVKMYWRLENARCRFALLEPWLVGHETFIDIGCGSGEMLEIASSRFAYCVGFDTNRLLIEHIRSGSRATVIEGHFDISALPPEAARRQTLFAASHVLEHLKHPLALVRQVTAAMHPGDIFYLEVPLYTGASFKRLGYDWSLWNREHLMLFSPQSLAWIAGQSGLETLSQGTRIFARGSRSMGTHLRLLRESPGTFLRMLFSKPRYLSVADVMVADYGFIVLRMPIGATDQITTK